MQLLLVLLLPLLALVSGQRPQLLRRNIIKVHASGFLPFESDLLLPLGILRQLQAEDRASRLLPPQQQLLYSKPRKLKPKPKPKPKAKQQVRLERAKTHSAPGVQMYNLIDDDGELLLNLRVHSETPTSTTTNNNYLDQHLDAVPQDSQVETLATPWRPSKWRPTARPPPAMTSSSPRPLPLHQYLSSNS
ncbi:hypothetical protein KR093_002446, partial [Drosophila rubida]